MLSNYLLYTITCALALSSPLYHNVEETEELEKRAINWAHAAGGGAAAAAVIGGYEYFKPKKTSAAAAAAPAAPAAVPAPAPQQQQTVYQSQAPVYVTSLTTVNAPQATASQIEPAAQPVAQSVAQPVAQPVASQVVPGSQAAVSQATATTVYEAQTVLQTSHTTVTD